MKIGQDEVIPSSEYAEFGIHLNPTVLTARKQLLVSFLTAVCKLVLGMEYVLLLRGQPSMRKTYVEIAVDYIKASRESQQGQTEADIRAFLRGNPQSALSDAEINEAFKRAGPRQTTEPAPSWMPSTIRQRYFRPVIAHPSGAIVHDGDCHIFASKICTCGLLHALVRLDGPEKGVEAIYPKFYDEYVVHDTALWQINNDRMAAKELKTDG